MGTRLLVINRKCTSAYSFLPTIILKQTLPFSTSLSSNINSSLNLPAANTKRNSAIVATTATDHMPSMHESLLHLRYIYVQTSINRWEDVPRGVCLDVGYLDSEPGVNPNPAVPLVVSLHTTPGSFYDLQPILGACVKAGCRVLAPAFPGIGYTEGVTPGYNDIFCHTTGEKAEFVRDFLVNVGVKKVDLLIGHGSGCYPAMRLITGSDTSSMFKSAAFMSPWPHRHFRGMKQRNLIPLLHDIWESPFYRPMAKALSWFMPQFRNASAQNRITAIRTLHRINFSEIGGFGVAFAVKKFPLAMFFATDDTFVDAEISYEFANLMGLKDDDILQFTGQLERGKMDHFPSCLVFEKGGQNLPQVHSGVITAVLFNLLKSVRPGFSAF